MKFRYLDSQNSSYICSLFIKLCNTEEKRNLVASLNNYKTIGKINFKARIPLYLNKISNDLAENKGTNDDNSQKDKK